MAGNDRSTLKSESEFRAEQRRRRQRVVPRMLARGLTCEEISKRLGVSGNHVRDLAREAGAA